MAVRFDPERLETSGQPVRVIEDVMQAIYAGNDRFETGAAQVTFSSSGTLVFAQGGVYPEMKMSLVRVDRNGESQSFGLPPRGYVDPRLSPDRTQLAYSVSRGFSGDIWIYDIVREVPRRLTTEGNLNMGPIWSPDGKWIVFSSDRNDSVLNLYRMAADGTGKPTRLTVSDGLQQVGSWSSEGVLAFLEFDLKTHNWDIWVLPPNGEAQPFFESPFMEAWPAFSPDGKWLAYASTVCQASSRSTCGLIRDRIHQQRLQAAVSDHRSGREMGSSFTIERVFRRYWSLTSHLANHSRLGHRRFFSKRITAPRCPNEAMTWTVRITL